MQTYPRGGVLRGCWKYLGQALSQVAPFRLTSVQFASPSRGLLGGSGISQVVGGDVRDAWEVLEKVKVSEVFREEEKQRE